MKKIMFLVVVLSLLLCGCSSWLDGSYHSVTPHSAENTTGSSGSMAVTTYLDLQEALVDMAEAGYQKSTFYIDGFDPEQADSYMDRAIRYIRDNSAVGSYAVDKIEYEVGSNGGRNAIVVNIQYLHGRSEILRMPKAAHMEAVSNLITNALRNCDAGLVVYVSQYEEMDLIRLVEVFAAQRPDLCMELPQVTVTVYPDRGKDRVISMNFQYQTDRETLRAMQETVSPVFSAAEMYVRGQGEARRKYDLLYSFVMERFDYQVETSNTPAYSLLCLGVGDSRAFATVYAAMCRQSGIECRIVTGTKAGQPYCWNMISLDEMYYHVDLLQCSADGEFLPKTDEEMAGYVWDYSAYE